MQAFVFPGQGAQSVGMVSGLGAAHPQIKARFEQASSVIGLDLWRLVAEGPTEELNKTQNTQPALLAASVAIWEIWRANGGARPALMAGHSFGEYSALVCSGALDFEAAVSLVADRGKFMQEAVPAGSGAMAAVLGADREVLEQICAEVSQTDAVQCANLNAAGQIVISGSASGVAQAGDLAKQAGAKKVIPLAVSVPAHSALMRPAAERFAARIADVPFAYPQIDVIHNVDLQSHKTPAAIRNALVQQLYSPVRWQETMECFVTRGVTRIIECGPGRVLAPLAKRGAPNAEIFSLVGPDELAAALRAEGARTHE